MKYLNAMKAEAKFEVILYFQNKIAVITDFIVFTSLFLSFFVLKSGSSLAATYNTDKEYSTWLMLIGYFIWTLSSRALSCVSSELNYESKQGFLYSKLTGILPIYILYFFKFIGSIFSQLIILLPVIIFSLILLPFPVISFNNILAIILILIANLIGMFGIGLIISCITVYDRRLTRVSSLFSTILIFTGNTITYNPLMDKYFKFFPLNFAIDSVRKLSLNNTIISTDLIIFLAICLIVYLLGVFLFNYFLKLAKIKGRLLWY